MNTTDSVGVAVEALYSVFSPYQKRGHIPGNCDCCSYDDVNEQIASKALRELSGDDLIDYFFLAVDNWGDVDDFKHFLPRILELMVREKDAPFHIGTLLDKLKISRCNTWPARERNALKAFFTEALQNRWRRKYVDRALKLLEGG